MGGAYNKLKEYQKAIDAYKEAIKIKPDYHEAL
jgi:cytochrome c-type biogenesis protein CcmH/NrfG